GGSFMAAFSAALAVYLMTKVGLPVSTTQAIVGGIIGWNLFSETQTDTTTLITILSTWVICPLLAAAIAAPLFKLVAWLLRVVKPHLLRQDAYTRLGLILAGAFGAYSLGANNIANVMGVFVPASPFTDFRVLGLVTFSSAQQLFMVGALAIAVGVMTYSRAVMWTVGGRLLPLSPVAAWVAVVAHSLVLFLFASEGLERLLAENGLPTIPLVPISSSQAVVGAVLGIGLIRGGRAIHWNVLGGIGTGWVLTPLIAGLVCFVGLFFLQNVFNQQVYRPVSYLLSEQVLERIERAGILTDNLLDLTDQSFPSARRFRGVLDEKTELDTDAKSKVMVYAERADLFIDPGRFAAIDPQWLSLEQIGALARLAGRRFAHRWALAEALARLDEQWRPRPDALVNKTYNKKLQRKLDWVYRNFSAER
ncbi:MAG: inorganic phosphate transporter, partial [Planctomycetota bacterium]